MTTRDPRTDFFAWTAAIGDHYFRDGAGTAPVYLSFDDNIAAQIGRGLGASVDDFKAAVSSVIEPEDEHPFRNADIIRDGNMGILGIVAAQVLAATWMGSFTADAATAYWRPFQRAFARGRELKSVARDELDSFWARTREHYAGLGRGILAIQRDPHNVPLAGKRHINFPLFQALLREVDRAQIRLWLRDYPEEAQFPTSTLLHHLRESAALFNKTLAQTLKDTAAHAVLATALETQLAELLRTLKTSNEESKQRRVGSRLRMVGLSSYEIWLQRSAGHGWIDVGSMLTDNEIRDGFDDDSSSARWSGDNRILFIDSGNDGAISHRGAVAPGARLFAVYRVDDHEAERALTAVRNESAPLSRPVEQYIARRFDVTEDDASLLQLFSCHLATTRAIHLEGGLSDRRVWLSARPPHVLAAPGVTQVLVNGCPTAVREGRVRLASKLPAGRYVIEVAGERITFDIEDGAELYDSSDGDEIVYSLSRAMETCSIERLTSKTYLVGAYIGVKPS